MVHTLLLRLKGPMQSWGVSSRFSIRDTGKEPSKSGVIGLLCAALGISRDEANTDNLAFAELIKLKMGVRVLREGVMQKDYHTAQEIAIANAEMRKDGTYKTKETELSTRWYLADADFLVGLESDDLSLLERLQNALENPKWQVFLGRKAFITSVPVYFREGVFRDKGSRELLSGQDECFEEILKLYRTEMDLKFPRDQEKQRAIFESIEGEDAPEVRQDVPLDLAARRFTIRRVTTSFITPKGGEKGDGDILNEDGS